MSRGRDKRRAGRGETRRPRFRARPLPWEGFLHASPTNQTLFAFGWKIGNRLITAKSGKRNASKGKGTKRGQPKSGGLLVYVLQPASHSPQKDRISCWLDYLCDQVNAVNLLPWAI